MVLVICLFLEDVKKLPLRAGVEIVQHYTIEDVPVKVFVWCKLNKSLKLALGLDVGTILHSTIWGVVFVNWISR